MKPLISGARDITLIIFACLISSAWQQGTTTGNFDKIRTHRIEIVTENSEVRGGSLECILVAMAS